MIQKMRKLVLFWGLALWVLTIQAQTESLVGASALIPKPLYCIEKPGAFKIAPEIKIYAPSQFAAVAKLLADQLPYHNQVIQRKKHANIVFAVVDSKTNLGKEGYQLKVAQDGILISAATAEGAIHAVFTLIQLQLLQPDMNKIPFTEITDNARFSYRGMHLDVSRNFYPLSFIRKYIDMMALYKYNTFHWHLTDGAGWRLEIKQYPLLTSRAAFRPNNTWKEWWKNGGKYSEEGSPNAYGGYYTQEDAKGIVAYAAQRGITVIPEIEMPGHSDEVLAVYPELSCSGKPYQNGEFCIGNPQTYTFLENILTEVMAIFPSTYIHVGGDEANTKSWETCPKCQNLKKEKGLKNEHELQSYLIKHMEQFLKSHGRRLIGWDEIVEGGLPADATVMNWRGESKGIEAVQQGHDVVMTPGETYLDAYQSDPSTQPETIGGFVPLQRIYNYEPVSQALTAEQSKHILGTQACVWTEYMPTTNQVEYMVYPRALALAEVAWIPKENKNFDDFHRRLQYHYRLLQRKYINYYRPSGFLTVVALPDYGKQQDLISFRSEQYKPEIRYTTDGIDPTAHSELYATPFYTSGKTEIKATIFKAGEIQGEVTNFTANYHQAIGKKVKFNTMWSDAYPAQKELTLTNGVRGSITYGDKQWLGYLTDFDVTIDMEKSQPISTIAVQFMHQPGPGVFLPSHVEVQFSDDGIKFTSSQKKAHNVLPDNPKLIFQTFTFDFKQVKARYIRIIAPNVMKGYMFVDEIEVN